MYLPNTHTPLSALTNDELTFLHSLARKCDDEVLNRLQADILDKAPTETASIDFSRPIDPSQFCGYQPSDKQQLFCEQLTFEGFYGGALGGGKTDALMMAASQFLHVPGYHAIIFRSTRPNCQDIIDRSQEWFRDFGKFVGNLRGGRWKFPSGAKLDFGYIYREADKYNYKGPEYQFVGFDEASEFLFTQYSYLKTRMRKKTCQRHHKTGFNPECVVCQVSKYLQGVPIRLRAASNPDNKGREWLLREFITDEAIRDIDADRAQPIYWKGKRFFIPSRVEENPGVNAEEYVNTALADLPPNLRAQLHRGSWSVIEGALLKQEWLRYWTNEGDLYVPHDSMHNPTAVRIDKRTCFRFATLDTASTGDAEQKRKKAGKEHSWSVCAVWDWAGTTQGGYLFLVHVWRAQVEWVDLEEAIPPVLQEWGVKKAVIEYADSGKALISRLNRDGFQVMAFHPTRSKEWQQDDGQPGKVNRSTKFQTMLSNGRIFLPLYENSGWRQKLEMEWITWTGDPDQPADQIDVASMAALRCEQFGAGSFPAPPTGYTSTQSVMLTAADQAPPIWRP